MNKNKKILSERSIKLGNLRISIFHQIKDFAKKSGDVTVNFFDFPLKKEISGIEKVNNQNLTNAIFFRILFDVISGDKGRPGSYLKFYTEEEGLATRIGNLTEKLIENIFPDSDNINDWAAADNMPFADIFDGASKTFYSIKFFKEKLPDITLAKIFRLLGDLQKRGYKLDENLKFGLIRGKPLEKNKKRTTDELSIKIYGPFAVSTLIKSLIEQSNIQTKILEKQKQNKGDFVDSIKTVTQRNIFDEDFISWFESVYNRKPTKQEIEEHEEWLKNMIGRNFIHSKPRLNYLLQKHHKRNEKIITYENFFLNQNINEMNFDSLSHDPELSNYDEAPFEFSETALASGTTGKELKIINIPTIDEINNAGKDLEIKNTEKNLEGKIVKTFYDRVFDHIVKGKHFNEDLGKLLKDSTADFEEMVEKIAEKIKNFFIDKENDPDEFTARIEIVKKINEIQRLFLNTFVDINKDNKIFKRTHEMESFFEKLNTAKKNLDIGLDKIVDQKIQFNEDFNKKILKLKKVLCESLPKKNTIKFDKHLNILKESFIKLGKLYISLHPDIYSNNLDFNFISPQSPYYITNGILFRFLFDKLESGNASRIGDLTETLIKDLIPESHNINNWGIADNMAFGDIFSKENTIYSVKFYKDNLPEVTFKQLLKLIFDLKKRRIKITNKLKFGIIGGTIKNTNEIEITKYGPFNLKQIFYNIYLDDRENSLKIFKLINECVDEYNQKINDQNKKIKKIGEIYLTRQINKIEEKRNLDLTDFYDIANILDKINFSGSKIQTDGLFHKIHNNNLDLIIQHGHFNFSTKSSFFSNHTNIIKKILNIPTTTKLNDALPDGLKQKTGKDFISDIIFNLKVGEKITKTPEYNFLRSSSGSFFNVAEDITNALIKFLDSSKNNNDMEDLGIREEFLEILNGIEKIFLNTLSDDDNKNAQLKDKGIKDYLDNRKNEIDGVDGSPNDKKVKIPVKYNMKPQRLSPIDHRLYENTD